MSSSFPQRPRLTAERPPLASDKYHKGTAPLTAREPLPPTKERSRDFEEIRKIQSEYTNAWEAHRWEKQALFDAWRYYFGANGEQWEEDAIKYKQENDQRITQYNIIKQKVKVFAGMLIADEYDFKYDPINGTRNSGIEALENAYYCDKETCHYDNAYQKVIEDGCVHLGIMEIGVTKEFDPRGNICFKRAVPGRWVIDPYWKTDDDRDCMRAWKQGHMTIKQIEETFKHLPSSPRFDTERQRLKKVGMDWTTPDINEYNYPYPLFRNAYHVIESHWVEKVNKKRIIAKDMHGQWVPFPVTEDVEALEIFAQKNGVRDWKEGEAELVPYEDKIHRSSIICPELWPQDVLEKGKPEIQVKGLPIIQFTLQRDISGRNSGMVQDLMDPQKDINFSQSKIAEFLANGLGGGAIYDKNRMPDESDQEDFEKNHNDIRRAWPIEGSVQNFMQRISDHQVNPELVRKTAEPFEYADRISGVSGAMQSQTEGSNEPASLYAMKLKVNKIGTLTVDKRVKTVRERMAECYFWQAQISYAGVERKFTSKDGKRVAILNEDMGGGYTKNDVTELPRSSVTISESENNLTKQMRDRADIAAVLESTPPEYREVIAIAIGELFKTTSLPEEQKEQIIGATMLEQIKAKLAGIAEIKNSDAMGKQAEVMSLQADAQIEQIMKMLQQSQQPAAEAPQQITQQPQAGPEVATPPDVSQQQPAQGESTNLNQSLYTE
jgi:hypothetical protein